VEDKETAVRREAAVVLGTAGPSTKQRASEALLKALKDTDPQVRATAIRSLSQVASGNVGQAIPVALKLLEASQFDGYSASIIFKSYAAEFCPQLIRALDHKSGADQAQLVSALYCFRGTSLPMLIEALGDAASPIRRGAIAVLTQIGPEARTAIPKLLGLTRLTLTARLRVVDAVTPLDAVEALLSVDPGRQTLATWLPTVETLLSEPPVTVQSRAVQILRLVGPATKHAVPTLLAAMAEAKGELRVHMALTLVELDRTQEAKALPVFLAALKDPAAPRQGEVVRALGAIGPPAKDAVPDLRKLLLEKKCTPDQRLALATSLTRIDPHEIAACLPIVLEPLVQPRRQVLRDRETLILLITWGKEARPAVPVIRKLVTAQQMYLGVQVAAAVALVLLDADEDQAGMKVIREVVRDREEDDGRYHLLQILGRLGPLGKPLVPVVRPLLKDAQWGQETHTVLARIDPKAEK
jgi:HEAT repeat protein